VRLKPFAILDGAHAEYRRVEPGGIYDPNVEGM
jgi:hypothetical protein